MPRVRRDLPAVRRQERQALTTQMKSFTAKLNEKFVHG
jgi:hypothetical protein